MTGPEQRPEPSALAVDHDLPAPVREAAMRLKPDSDLSNYKPADKLAGKVALITGGDSGIGRAVAIAYAMEGADVAIAFNHSEDDAAETRRLVEAKGRRCLTLLADVTVAADRERIVRETVAQLGRLDVLVNNAAYFEGDGALPELEEDGLRRTLETNIMAPMLLAKAALPQLEQSRRTIHQHLEHDFAPRQEGLARLFEQQGCAQRVHQVSGARTRRERDSRERGFSGRRPLRRRTRRR
jgi:NAD(P)-dependent dehydrogenase (short-subunit alcohol dehydrogenase family)